MTQGHALLPRTWLRRGWLAWLLWPASLVMRLLVAVRRAARAVQAGDADIVACISGDTNHVDSFRSMLGSFSAFARDAT